MEQLTYLLVWFIAFACCFIIYFVRELSDSNCNAPCTVHFDSTTAEDDFRIDWRNQTLYVYKDGNH